MNLNPSPPRTYYLGTGALKGPLRVYYLGTCGAKGRKAAKPKAQTKFNDPSSTLPSYTLGQRFTQKQETTPLSRHDVQFQVHWCQLSEARGSVWSLVSETMSGVALGTHFHAGTLIGPSLTAGRAASQNALAGRVGKLWNPIPTYSRVQQLSWNMDVG